MNKDEIALISSCKWRIMIKIQKKDFNIEDEINLIIKSKYSNM